LRGLITYPVIHFDEQSGCRSTVTAEVAFVTVFVPTMCIPSTRERVRRESRQSDVHARNTNSIYSSDD
jgi:hypothetical protein